MTCSRHMCMMGSGVDTFAHRSIAWPCDRLKAPGQHMHACTVQHAEDMDMLHA